MPDETRTWLWQTVAIPVVRLHDVNENPKTVVSLYSPYRIPFTGRDIWTRAKIRMVLNTTIYYPFMSSRRSMMNFYLINTT